MIALSVIKMGRRGWFYTGFVNACLLHLQDTYPPYASPSCVCCCSRVCLCACLRE